MPLEVTKYIALADPEDLARRLALLARDVSPQLLRRGAFRAYRNAALALAAGNQFVKMDQVEYDLENEYDPATGIFQPRHTAVYRITAGLAANTNQAVGSNMELKIYLNGARERYFRYETIAVASAPQYNGADDFLVQAGGQYQVVAATTAGGGGNTNVLTGTSATWFSAHWLRDIP